MKEIKIKIIVPKGKKPWKVSVPHSAGKQYADVTTAYNKVERYIFGLPVRDFDKIIMKVDYSSQYPSHEIGWENESISSTKKEGLYALICFLEDFTKNDFAQTKYRKYGPHYE